MMMMMMRSLPCMPPCITRCAPGTQFHLLPISGTTWQVAVPAAPAAAAGRPVAAAAGSSAEALQQHEHAGSSSHSHPDARGRAVPASIIAAAAQEAAARLQVTFQQQQQQEPQRRQGSQQVPPSHGAQRQGGTCRVNVGDAATALEVSRLRLLLVYHGEGAQLSWRCRSHPFPGGLHSLIRFDCGGRAAPVGVYKARAGADQMTALHAMHHAEDECRILRLDVCVPVCRLPPAALQRTRRHGRRALVARQPAKWPWVSPSQPAH